MTAEAVVTIQSPSERYGDALMDVVLEQCHNSFPWYGIVRLKQLGEKFGESLGELHLIASEEQLLNQLNDLPIWIEAGPYLQAGMEWPVVLGVKIIPGSKQVSARFTRTCEMSLSDGGECDGNTDRFGVRKEL